MGPDDLMFDEDPGGIDLFQPTGFDAVFGVVIVLIVAVLVIGVALTLRRAKRFKDAGIDPIDPQADIAIRLARSRSLAPPPPEPPAAAPVPSLSARLAELDALHHAGTITAVERDAARAKLLGTL